MLMRLAKSVHHLCLSAAAVMLCVEALVRCLPFRLPASFVASLWSLYILRPVVRILTHETSSFGWAVSTNEGYWQPAIGAALVLLVLSTVGSSARPRVKWSSLALLALSLGGMVAAESCFPLPRSGVGHLLLGVCLGFAAGISLVGLGIGMAKRNEPPLARRSTQAIRVLLVIAGAGIGSFVLAPLGWLALALLQAGIALEHARVGLQV